MRKTKTSKPPVIIIGIDHYLGVQTARIFARHGVPVIGIAKNSKHFGCRTNVCEKILYADVLSEELIDTLTTLGPELPQKAVLLPCRDMSVLMVSRHREKLAPYFHFALPEKDTIEMLMDKMRFYDYAQKNNLPVPKFQLLHNRRDAEDAARNLRYPCILKPPMKAPRWETQTQIKAFKIADAQEFMQVYDRCCGWAEVLMAQEWISGGDANNYSCNGYFNAQSEPLVTFTARKLRQWPPETGNTSLGEECRDDTVSAAALELFQKVHFFGLTYLEMKRDQRSGTYFIIEPNIGRPTGRSPLAEGCGVEMLYTMYCDLTGLPLPENRRQKFTGTKWIYLRLDLQSALAYWRRGDLTLGEWWRSLKGRKMFAVFSWRDPMPFLHDFKTRLLWKFEHAAKKPAKSGSEQSAQRVLANT